MWSGAQAAGVIFESVMAKRYIVTNYHVIQGAKAVEISWAMGSAFGLNWWEPCLIRSCCFKHR